VHILVKDVLVLLAIVLVIVKELIENYLLVYVFKDIMKINYIIVKNVIKNVLLVLELRIKMVMMNVMNVQMKIIYYQNVYNLNKEKLIFQNLLELKMSI
jgi:hypothetical protein